MIVISGTKTLSPKAQWPSILAILMFHHTFISVPFHLEFYLDPYNKKRPTGGTIT